MENELLTSLEQGKVRPFRLSVAERSLDVTEFPGNPRAGKTHSEAGEETSISGCVTQGKLVLFPGLCSPSSSLGVWTPVSPGPLQPLTCCDWGAIGESDSVFLLNLILSRLGHLFSPRCPWVFEV